MEDPPHFSLNPIEFGYENLSEAINVNKSHFDQILMAAKEGMINLNEIKDVNGNLIGYSIKINSETNLSDDDVNTLIFNLINFTK